MEDIESPQKRDETEIEYQTFAKNTFFSVLYTYGDYILAFIISFLLARMISQEDWGILILATSLILILVSLTNFIPPGLTFALNFYIPRYRAKKNITKLRSFILKAIYFRLFATILFFFIGLLIFWIFYGFFSVYLNNHQVLLFILLPLVFITSFDTFIKFILNGFNLFKLNLVFLLIKSIVNIVPLLFYFLTTNSIDIETVALINLFSALTPLIFEVVILLIKIPRGVSDSNKGISFKSFVMKVLKYGSVLRIQGFLGEIWLQGQTQAIRVYENPEWVTGYNISRNYTRISGMFLTALNAPLLYSFSSMDYKEDYDKIISMYKNVFYYSLFLFLIISGVLILLSDFFMGFVFGEDYVVYSILNKLTLISGVISIYASLYLILLRTTYRIKQQIYILVIGFPAQIILFFIGIVTFGILGVLVIDIIWRIVTLSIIGFVSIKVMKVDVNLLKIFTFYATFFFSILLSSFLDNLILKDVSFQFWELLNLSLFNQLNLLDVLVFLISFLFLNIIFKAFTKTDLEYIEQIFTSDKISHNTIRRFLRLFKRFLR